MAGERDIVTLLLIRLGSNLTFRYTSGRTQGQRTLPPDSEGVHKEKRIRVLNHPSSTKEKTR